MRPSLDDVLLSVARVWSRRSTCSLLSVGAVLAVDSRTISTGYNGTAAGMPHCQHEPEDTRCPEAVHAEANAIAFAARHGIATSGAAAYVTHAPCVDCANLLINAGISRVVYGEHYKSTGGLVLLEEAGIRALQL